MRGFRRGSRRTLAATLAIVGMSAAFLYSATPVHAQWESPQGSYAHSLESDGLYGGVWLFGGSFGGFKIPGGTLDELWVFEPLAATWTRITPKSRKNPGPRRAHASAYDTTQDLYVIFGGRATTRRGNELVNDTWFYSPDPGTERWSNATGCPDGGTTSSLQTAQGGGKPDKGGGGGKGGGDKGNGPPAREFASMAYNPWTEETTLFGGTAENGGLLRDTWTLQINGGESCWTDEGTLNPKPPARTEAAMTYVASSDTMVLYGGRDNSPQNFSDLWEWDGFSWAEIVQTNGPSIRAHSLAYDADTDRLIVFGGQLGALDDTTPSQLTYFYDFKGNWSSEESPVTLPRSFAPAVLDPETNSMILFGGTNGNFTLDDTWIIPLDGVSPAQCINRDGDPCNL